jgi:thioredoxin reductase (NADPH)
MRHGIARTFKDHDVRAVLADGSEIHARAALSATGVRWRRLGLEGEDEWEGAGIYYGAGTSEASACIGLHVFVVGGANSAGQAAMNLAAHSITFDDSDAETLRRSVDGSREPRGARPMDDEVVRRP